MGGLPEQVIRETENGHITSSPMNTVTETDLT